MHSHLSIHRSLVSQAYTSKRRILIEVPGIRIECLIAILMQNRPTYMHEQITKGFGIMNTCISRFVYASGTGNTSMSIIIYTFWKCKPVVCIYKLAVVQVLLHSFLNYFR